jgi:hypothetical protein
MIEGAQGRLGSFSDGDDDLLVRNDRAVTGREYAGHGRLATRIDFYFSAR